MASSHVVSDRQVNNHEVVLVLVAIAISPKCRIVLQKAHSVTHVGLLILILKSAENLVIHRWRHVTYRVVHHNVVMATVRQRPNLDRHRLILVVKSELEV